MTSRPLIPYLEARPPSGVRSAGELVLLHAFPLNAHMWDAQLSACAAAGWRVVAPHWRGVQDDDVADASFDAMAESVADLLDALHIESPVVCGVSMGGYLAFALLRRSPAMARALVLCDTRAEADAPPAKEGRLRMLASLRDQGVDAVADEMIPRLLGETTRRSHPEIVEQVRGLALGNRPGGLAGVITAMMLRHDSTPTLPVIQCPTLVMVGEEDVITTPAMSQQMHQAIAGSQLITFERAGHLPNLEQPERFNDTLKGFLATLSERAV